MCRNWGRWAAAIAFAALIAFSTATPLRAGGDETDALSVVVSIRPIHSLVAGVMDGVGAPSLLLSGRPGPETAYDADQRMAIEHADVIVWIGPHLEKSLERVIVGSGRDLRDIPLMNAPGVRLMDIRSPEAVRSARAAEAAPQGRSTASGERETRQVSRRDVLPERPDPRIWLSPRNAVAMVRAIARVLAEADPDHASRYRRNELTLTIRIETLDGEVGASLGAAREGRYATVDNSFQYFERNYVLDPHFRIDVASGGTPQTAAAAAWRRRILAEGVECVLRPAGFDVRFAGRLVHRTPARLETVDPYGRAFAPGPDAYFATIRHVAGRFAECLNPGDG